MSELQQLIQKLCPNGVEYKTLGEVCIAKRGKTLTAKNAMNGDIPVVAGGIKPAYYHNEANRTGQNIVVAGSGTAGYVSYWEIPIFVSDAFTIHPCDCLDIKYLFYFLKNIQDKIYSLKQGSGTPHVYWKSMEPFEIPIPPIEVQKEIVQILDSFQNLQAELQAELQARQEQYEYYRNKLLSFENSQGGYKKLGEMVKVNRGKRLTKSQLSNDSEYEVYHGSKDAILGKYCQYNAPANTTIVVNTGSIGGVKFLDKPFWCSDGSFWLGHNDKINNKYMYYCLSGYEDYFYSQRRIGGVPTIDRSVIENFEIPIPPIEEQKRIVAILDKFYALINDLSQGLPAEIEALQQQYEYYRDKLLSFPKYKERA